MSLGIAAISPKTSATLTSLTRNRGLRVLTLTPFYPSVENGWEGGFIAEVLPWTQELGIKNEVIAVRPLYRERVHPTRSEIPCMWANYFALPGNLGLPSAGTFVASKLLPLVRKAHSLRSFDLIHAHAALPCGDAAEKISAELRNEYVLGYKPDDERRDGKWRKVKVKLMPPAGLPQLTVHARTGYYAPLQ